MAHVIIAWSHQTFCSEGHIYVQAGRETLFSHRFHPRARQKGSETQNKIEHDLPGAQHLRLQNSQPPVVTRLQGGNAEKSSEVAALALVLNFASPWSQKRGDMFPQVQIGGSCQNNSHTDQEKFGSPS